MSSLFLSKVAKPSISFILSYVNSLKKEDIPVTGRRGSWDCETSRIPPFLENRLTDGGEVASLMRRPSFTPQEDSWYSFLLEGETTPGRQCGWKN
jgi:hypothetical protein